MINTWNSFSKFLFEKEKTGQDKFKTYLSPYFVPKAYRFGCENAFNTFIELKYLDVNEGTQKVTHPENHRIYFEIGEKTKRVYKVYFYSIPASSCKDIEVQVQDIENAFKNLSSKFCDNSTDKYIAAIAATKQGLSSIDHAKLA